MADTALRFAVGLLHSRAPREKGRRVVGPDRRDIADNAEVKLTLFSASAEARKNARRGGGVKALFRVIKANPGRRVPGLAQLTGVSRRTIERHLKDRLAARVEFRGPPKTGGYYAK